MTKKRHKKIEQKKIARECWNLDLAFRNWLSPRLKTYLRDADKIVNLEYHKFTIDGIEKTQKEWIIEMIRLVDWLSIEDNWWYESEEYANNLESLGKIWGTLLPAMWW